MTYNSTAASITEAAVLLFSAEYTIMNDGRDICDTSITPLFYPFGDDCRDAIEIEHHNIMLLIPWIMKSIQYGIEDLIK